MPCATVAEDNLFGLLSPEDDSDSDSDDEEAMVAAIQEPAKLKSILKERSKDQPLPQAMTPATFAKLKAEGKIVTPLTPDRIAAIDNQIRQGLIKLPPCKPNEIWCMVDSGSAPHVADMHKHFPGASLRQSSAQKTGTMVATATGCV